MTGKNTSTAAISAFESGLMSPNQLLISGANAMIGTALAATASGSRMPRAVTKRAATNATARPASVPISSPTSASWSVAIADGQEREPAVGPVRLERGDDRRRASGRRTSGG